MRRMRTQGAMFARRFVRSPQSRQAVPFAILTAQQLRTLSCNGWKR